MPLITEGIRELLKQAYDAGEMKKDVYQALDKAIKSAGRQLDYSSFGVGQGTLKNVSNEIKRLTGRGIDPGRAVGLAKYIDDCVKEYYK